MNDFVASCQKELVDFFSPHFESKDTLMEFLSDAFDYENGSVTKRQMLYQTQRFVSLANNIEKISSSSDGLRILFLRICLESLQSLSNCKKERFFDDFCDSFSNDGKDYILSHFKLVFFEDEYEELTLQITHDITLLDFLWIIKTVRDRIIHDGELWSTQFFSHDDNSSWYISVETDKKMIKSYQYHRPSKKMVEYHFETALNYERFIFYFVEACINYINKTNNIRE